MDSRSALLREFRARRRIRIIKRDESFFSYFFLLEREYMELELRSVEVQGARGRRACPRGRACPHPRGQGVGPLQLILSLVFFINSKKCSVDFQVILRTFISA